MEEKNKKAGEAMEQNGTEPEEEKATVNGEEAECGADAKQDGSDKAGEASDKGSDKPEKPAKKKKRSARELEVALEKSEGHVAELTDKYQRLMAEFENARKRTAKESSRMYDIGAKEILEKLLPVIDNFERGLLTLTDEEKKLPFVQGIDKIYKQFLTVLADCHVEVMDACGKEFNPDFHNAVMHIEQEDVGENVVVEELLKGYMYKDMVLRYSMVKVAN